MGSSEFWIVALLVLIILFAITIGTVTIMARTLGAEMPTAGRVALAFLLILLMLIFVSAVLGFALFPDPGTIARNADQPIGSIIWSEMLQLGSVWAAIALPLILILCAAIIFSLCVRLGLVKSFLVMSMTALISVVLFYLTAVVLPVTGLQQSITPVASQASTLAENVIKTTGEKLPTRSDADYSGGLNDRRIALQQRARLLCDCHVEANCTADSMAYFEQAVARHVSRYGATENVAFLSELEDKVVACTDGKYARHDANRTVILGTGPTLDEAIALYYQQAGEEFAYFNRSILEFSQLQRRRNAEQLLTAHAEFRYRPVAGSGEASDGIENRVFDYRENDDGSFTVYAMSAPGEARFTRETTDSSPRFRAVDKSQLSLFVGSHMRMTQVVGEPLEGTLETLDGEKLLLRTTRRDGEVAYEIPLSNLRAAEVWR